MRVSIFSPAISLAWPNDPFLSGLAIVFGDFRHRFILILATLSLETSHVFFAFVTSSTPYQAFLPILDVRRESNKKKETQSPYCSPDADFIFWPNRPKPLIGLCSPLLHESSATSFMAYLCQMTVDRRDEKSGHSKLSSQNRAVLLLFGLWSCYKTWSLCPYDCCDEISLPPEMVDWAASGASVRPLVVARPASFDATF